MPLPTAPIDKRRLTAAFGAAAERYDRYAYLQRLISDRVLERLDVVRIAPTWILDLGAGTGYGARGLVRRYPRARVVLCDMALPMLMQARRNAPRWRPRAHYVCGEAEVMPLRPASIDLVFSSLALQWCNDLDAVFGECRRVLRPAGLLLFSTLGPDTLCELRAAWAAVDSAPHVNAFADLHDVGDALIRAGFSSPVVDMEKLTLLYGDALSLMRDLKALGARSALSARPRGLSARHTLARIEAAYERFRTEGRLPATYELIYGHAWCPSAGTRPQDGSTVSTFPMARLRTRR